MWNFRIHSIFLRQSMFSTYQQLLLLYTPATLDMIRHHFPSWPWRSQVRKKFLQKGTTRKGLEIMRQINRECIRNYKSAMKTQFVATIIIVVIFIIIIHFLWLMKCFSHEEKNKVQSVLVLLTTEVRICSETGENKSSVHSNALK